MQPQDQDEIVLPVVLFINEHAYVLSFFQDLLVLLVLQLAN